MMYIIKQTEMFTKWLRKLRDLRARIAIARRIERAQKGNLGGHRSIGKNLFETRMTIGPGHRI
jgi:putative addiction module killer protein